jgi:hypothetical protein
MAKVNVDMVKTVNSIGFNEEKTKELIKTLMDEGSIVGIEDLGRYIKQQGLIVHEHIGRKRNYVETNPKMFGVDTANNGEELAELFKEHIQMGKISFLPSKYEKKLANLESSVRMARRRASIGYEDSFMTLEIYRGFKEEFDNRKKEYFDIRDEILGMWEGLMRRFSDILKISLVKLNNVDKDVLYAAIMQKLPSKKDYENSFRMWLTVKAFPVTENLDMFDESIQSQIRDGLNEDTITTLYDIIGNTLDDAFESVSKVLWAIQKNDKIANKTFGSIRKTADRIGQKNIFHNPKIEEIRLAILVICSNSNEVEVVAEQSEHLLSIIYGYAKELGIEDSIKTIKDSPLSAEELLAIYGILETSQEAA